MDQWADCVLYVSLAWDRTKLLLMCGNVYVKRNVLRFRNSTYTYLLSCLVLDQYIVATYMSVQYETTADSLA